jgi:hypothetical protein
LSVEDGVVTGKDGRRVSYAELIGSKHFDLQLSPSAKRRTPSDWKVLGKPVPSLDRPALMTGTFEFVHNVRVPGMLHGRVVRPPEVGATVVSLDETSVRKIAGIVKVVRQKDFVGVVAEKQLQAEEAARKLKVTWAHGRGLPPQKTYFDSLRKQPSRDTLIVDSKDIEKRLASAHKVLRATYAYPYQMHGSIGASCAVADVKGDHATVWSGTQSVYPTRSIVAKLLGLPLENVRVIFARGAGCYGLNGSDAVSFDAALLSHGVGRPVRVRLSRQDEMAWENFGSAFVIDQRAGIDQNGGIVTWECESWMAERGGRPGYDDRETSLRESSPVTSLNHSLRALRLNQRANFVIAVTTLLLTLQDASATTAAGPARFAAKGFWRMRWSLRSLQVRCALLRESRTPSRTSASWMNSPLLRKPIRLPFVCNIFRRSGLSMRLTRPPKPQSGKYALLRSPDWAEQAA